MFAIVLDLEYYSESALIAQTRFYIFIFDLYDKTMEDCHILDNKKNEYIYIHQE